MHNNVCFLQQMTLIELSITSVIFSKPCVYYVGNTIVLIAIDRASQKAKVNIHTDTIGNCALGQAHGSAEYGI